MNRLIQEKVKILEISLEEYKSNWWYNGKADIGGFTKTGMKLKTPYYRIKVDLSFGNKNNGVVTGWNIPINDNRVLKLMGRHEDFIGKTAFIESVKRAETRDDVYAWVLLGVEEE